jgi:hypothetical protein
LIDFELRYACSPWGCTPCSTGALATLEQRLSDAKKYQALLVFIGAWVFDIFPASASVLIRQLCKTCMLAEWNFVSTGTDLATYMIVGKISITKATERALLASGVRDLECHFE